MHGSADFLVEEQPHEVGELHGAARVARAQVFFERHLHLARRSEPLLGIEGQRPAQDIAQAPIELGNRVRHLGAVDVHDRVEHLCGIGLSEQLLAGEQLVKNQSHGKDIAAGVERTPCHLLRRQVRELAFQHPASRFGILRDRLGDAEVHDLDVAVVRNEHVLWADVAVDDA